MGAVAAMSAVSFAGFGMLFATVPLWAVRAGADAAGAGAINGVLMLATVLTQTMIPASLRRLGWAATLIVGLAALGLPSFLFLLSGELWWLMALSAVRGLGFGVLTVCGSAAIAELGHGAGKMLAATVVGKKRTLTASHPSRTSRWPAHHVRAPDDTANPATFRTALPSRALGVAHA